MSGLTGALSFDNSRFTVTPEYIARMRETMVHRGPDGAGAWISPDRRVGLGHRRLAIIDLTETAQQPMASQDGTLRLVYNGEIYNHAELKRELESLGRTRWLTDHSDTEVLLQAYAQWGIDALQKLRGMFAFALWDARSRVLWLARDRVGIKPLYYSVHHGRITFGSEIKALLADPDQPKAVNEEAFYHYLSFLATPSPHTLFEGIKKLPPGHWLRVQPNGSLHLERYWDVYAHTNPVQDMTEADLGPLILNELETSVRLCKASDVPVGVFLSGDIGSSANAALFADGEDPPIQTFSIGYSGRHRGYHDEMHGVRQMANQVGARHHERLLNAEDLLTSLPGMVHLQDEPAADPLCAPVYYAAQLAREHGVPVCQVSDGADELFWGHPGWKTALQLESINSWPVPGEFKRLALAGLRVSGRDGNFSYERLRRGALGLPMFWGGAEAFPEAMKPSLLSPRLKKKFRGFTSWEALRPLRQRFLETTWDPSPLNWMTYLDLHFRLPELILMRLDKMSMGVSLEARAPFLDHKFVELALSLPQEIKTKNGELMYLLKLAVRGLIPDKLIDRKKQDAGVPAAVWSMGKLGDTTRRELEYFCRETDFLNPRTVFDLLDRPSGGQAWHLLNLALWWRRTIAGAPAPDPQPTHPAP
ncbi:MAG: asparagine synthase (glutamine-hydrolyzing) [Nitrospinaceae bacterium]